MKNIKIVVCGLLFFSGFVNGSDNLSFMSEYQLNRYRVMADWFDRNPHQKINGKALLEIAAKNHADFIEIKDEYDEALCIENCLKCLVVCNFSLVVVALLKGDAPVISVVACLGACIVAQRTHVENESRRKLMTDLSCFRERLAPQEILLIRKHSKSKNRLTE